LEISNFLIILVGLPASGKSTLAKSLKEQLIEKFGVVEEQVSIIDPDLIRNYFVKNLNEFDYTLEPKIRVENLENVEKELKNNKFVISDDLNYYRSMRHDLKSIAVRVGVPYFIIHLKTPILTCLKWNNERGTPIPEDVIYKINEKMDKFDRYNWDFPVYSIDLSAVGDIDEKSQEILDTINMNLQLKAKTAEIPKKKEIEEKVVSRNEELDLLTRKIVSKIINEKGISLDTKKISKLRKRFLKKNVESSLSNDDIAENFKNFIENELKNLRK